MPLQSRLRRRQSRRSVAGLAVCVDPRGGVGGRRGGDGRLADLAGAAALFRQSARNGSVEAQYYLGRLLYFGKDGTQNAAEAVAWLEKAAESGHVQAQGTLGAVLLAKGGADARAFDLIRRAARSGDGASMYWLGLCLAYGRGTAQDIPQALLWYQRAAASGHAKAQQALADLERQGIKPPR